MAINTTSAFVAAREAIASFQKSPDEHHTFMYTGNAANEGPVPGFLSLGAGKTAGAHIVQMADNLYKDK